MRPAYPGKLGRIVPPEEEEDQVELRLPPLFQKNGVVSLPPPSVLVAPPRPPSPPPPPPVQHPASYYCRKLDEMDEELWLRMGRLAEEMGCIEQALACFLRALRHNPNNPEMLLHVAGIYDWKGQYEDEVSIFERVLNLQNQNGRAWCALGHTLLKMNEPSRAYTAYQQALFTLANPRDPDIWYGIGLLYERCKNWEHAAEVYLSLLKATPPLPQRPEIWYRYGVVLRAQGEPQKALNAFQEAIHCPPPPLTTADMLCLCASIYEEEKDYDSARLTYERALQEAPDDPDVLQRYAWLLQFSPGPHDTPRAVAALERAVDSDPDDALSCFMLGRSYAALGNFPEAFSSFQDAVNNDPSVPDYWAAVGTLYYVVGQYRDALDAYSHAIRTAGGTVEPAAPGSIVQVVTDTKIDIPEVWYNLGTLYEECNQPEDAVEALQHAAKNLAIGKLVQERIAEITENARAGIRRPGAKEGELPVIERNGRPLLLESHIALDPFVMPEFHSAFSDYTLLPPKVFSLLRELKAMEVSFEPTAVTPLPDFLSPKNKRSHRSTIRAQSCAQIVIVKPPPGLVAERAIHPPPPPSKPYQPRNHHRHPRRPKPFFSTKKSGSALISAAGMPSANNVGSALKRSLPITEEQPRKIRHV